MKYAVMQWNWIKITDIWTIDAKKLGFIEMCYVFSYLCVPLIGSDHVVNKLHFCKESVFLVGLVWKKAHWRFFRHCTLFIVQIFDSWTVNWMLFVCYMNKQAGAEFSQAYLANYELCWIFTFVLGLSSGTK